MLMPVTVTPVALLSAMSLAGSLVTDWPAPLPLTSLSLGQAATPEPAEPSARAGSAPEKPTVTLPEYQPAAFAGACWA